MLLDAESTLIRPGIVSSHRSAIPRLCKRSGVTCAAVYDVARRETFENLERVWMTEVELYSNIEEAVKIVVANKVDLSLERDVSSEQGHDFARKHGCLYVETSAKANVAVGQAFEELVLRILETPALLDPGSGLGMKLNQPAGAVPTSCSC